MYPRFLCILFLFCTAFLSRYEIAAEEILLKTDPKKYQLRISLELKSVDARPDVLVAELPLPETNEYQTIQRLATSPGKVLAYPENGEKYLACRFEGAECPEPGKTATIFHEFEATLYDITVDFSKIEKIHPYNKDTDLYRRYTGKSGVFVDPNNAEIKRIAEQLAAETRDPVEFARKAYIYVSDHYKYLNPNTGLASLETLLRNGGGDCGNISSIFISLLRNQGIPARHVVAVRPDASYHVWAEFYLEKYGWIPVDATHRLQDKVKTDDYFGRVRVNGNGVILSRDVDISVVDNSGNSRKVALMQTFAYWHLFEPPSAGKVECRYFLTTVSQPNPFHLP